MSLFGEYFKYLRKNYAKKTLKEFCTDGGLDIRRMVKIERGVIMPTIHETSELSVTITPFSDHQYATLIELRKLNDTRTYIDLSPHEISEKKKDIYRNEILFGNKEMTWDMANEIVKEQWSVGENNDL